MKLVENIGWVSKTNPIWFKQESTYAQKGDLCADCSKPLKGGGEPSLGPRGFKLASVTGESVVVCENKRCVDGYIDSKGTTGEMPFPYLVTFTSMIRQVLERSSDAEDSIDGLSGTPHQQSDLAPRSFTAWSSQQWINEHRDELKDLMEPEV